jgi:hypothetical protein
MEADISGYYAYNFKQSFRQGTSTEALTALINSAVTLSVAEATSGSIIAQAHLDMVPLALGFSNFKLLNLALTPLNDSTSPSPVKVRYNLGIKDSLLGFVEYVHLEAGQVMVQLLH